MSHDEDGALAALREKVNEMAEDLRAARDDAMTTNKMLVGFVGPDNRWHVGLVGRVTSLEEQIAKGTDALAKASRWGVRLLVVAIVMMALQMLGVHPQWTDLVKML